MTATQAQIDANAILDKVREMRTAQQEYFKYRYREKLERAKQLEAEVDELLDRVSPKGQAKLFH